MTGNTFQDIEKLEADLWSAADNLRANSKLTSSDYFLPVLGIIFLRHAANRHEAATAQIAEEKATGRLKRPVSDADYASVVTGRYGTIGEVYFIEDDYWPHNTALYVSEFKGNHPRMILHVLRHVLQSIQSDKAAVPGLNRNVVPTLEIVWPCEDLRAQFDDFLKPIVAQQAVLVAMNEKIRAARDLLLPRLMSGELAV